MRPKNLNDLSFAKIKLRRGKKFYQAHNKISKNHSDFELIDLEEVLGHKAKRVKHGVFLLTLGEIIRQKARQTVASILLQICSRCRRKRTSNWRENTKQWPCAKFFLP